MKIRKLARGSIALATVGVFLGRAAQADTILDFDVVPVGQPNNGAPGILQTFGDYAAASSDGVTVVGFGTPNIGLSWTASAVGDARWDYYNDGGNVWMGAQLNNSAIGVAHSVIFTPDNPSARVAVKSFNFHPYYVSTERFTYNVSVLAGATVVSGPIPITYISDATKNHPVSINYTGAPGRMLKLEIARVASTLGAGEIEGGAYNIAVDDIRFAQAPETTFPAGPQVVSVSPVEGTTGIPANFYPYQASITNGATTLAPGSIQLRLDNVPVSASISSGGGTTNVSYTGTSLLPSGSVHTYSLTYSDSGGAAYTHEVVFAVANYATLPAAYGLPSGAGVTAGFTARTVAANTTNTLDGSLARAEAQLAGTLIDPRTSQPFTNAAARGPNPDGSFNIDTYVNFDDDGNVFSGHFSGDVPFPGLDLPGNNWFSMEALLYLDLAPGYYRFGVNSDDGFGVTLVPPQGVAGSPIALGSYDGDRGADDTVFDFLVQTGGIYPFRLVYFESTGNALCEFYSVDPPSSTLRYMINDTVYPNAIKSYRVLKPKIISITRSGQNADIQWAYGNPPFQLQFMNDLKNPNWVDSGSATSNRTATVAIQPGVGYFRVGAQP